MKAIKDWIALGNKISALWKQDRMARGISSPKPIKFTKVIK